MKIKMIFIILMLIFAGGCTKTKDLAYEDITQNLENKIEKWNVYHTGYKYYLPSDMQLKDYMLYNDVIKSDKYTYYLYVDVISYYNKINVTDNYETDKDAYLFLELNYNDQNGYLEIKLQENNQYLIEIMFNYAKIEVMVDYEDINLALSYAVSILRSMEYNEEVIANVLGEDILNFQEEVYNIFGTTKDDSLLNRDTEEDDENNSDNYQDGDVAIN